MATGRIFITKRGSGMKICFINFDFYTPRAVLPTLYEYSQIFSTKGFEVTVFVRDSEETIKSMGNLTVRKVCKESPSLKITHILFLIKLVFLLRKERFDIVHIFYCPGVAILPIFCKKHHGKWILDIQTWKIWTPIKKFFYDRLMVLEARFFNKIFILNEHLKGKLFGKKPPENIYITPLGANIEKFVKVRKDRAIWRKYGLSEKSVIFVYHGLIHWVRNLKDMLRAFKIVREEVANKELKLVIIGGKNADDLEMLKKEANSLFLREHVLFMGQIPYEDIPVYLSNSDMGLAYVPKIKVYDIQPPQKTFEYLAASLPVVATDTLGNMEIIEDGINGVIAQDSPQAFSHGMLRLLKDDQLRSKIKNNAFNSVVKYDWGNVAERIARIYAEN